MERNCKCPTWPAELIFSLLPLKFCRNKRRREKDETEHAWCLSWVLFVMWRVYDYTDMGWQRRWRSVCVTIWSVSNRRCSYSDWNVQVLDASFGCLSPPISLETPAHWPFAYMSKGDNNSLHSNHHSTNPRAKHSKERKINLRCTYLNTTGRTQFCSEIRCWTRTAADNWCFAQMFRQLAPHTAATEAWVTA